MYQLDIQSVREGKLPIELGTVCKEILARPAEVSAHCIGVTLDRAPILSVEGINYHQI